MRIKSAWFPNPLARPREAGSRPRVGLCSAIRGIRGIQAFSTDGLADSRGVVCVKLPTVPKTVILNGQPAAKNAHDYIAGVLRIRFPNGVQPTKISITW